MTIIRVIDFETTGADASAEVCEVGICDVDVEAKRVFRIDSWLCGVSSMPPQARSVHHIALADCKDLPPFDAAEMEEPNCDVMAAHNSDFETQFFTSDVPVICTYKAALRMWPDAPGHSNSVLRYWLEDQGKIAPAHALTQPAHRAGPDAYTTAHILLALLAEGTTVERMVAWTKEPRLMPVCPIGKFRGKPWGEVEAGFLSWMLRQPDMEADLQWNARRELTRRQGGQA